VLKARDRRGTRDLETQLGVLYRRAHDSHVRKRYWGRETNTRSRLRHCSVTRGPIRESPCAPGRVDVINT
jgi:hypothetical protein